MNIIDSSMNLLMILSPSLPSQVTVECPSRRASTLAGRDLLLWTRMKSAQRCARPGRRGSSTAGLLLPGQSLCRSHGALVRRRVQTDVPASGGGLRGKHIHDCPERRFLRPAIWIRRYVAGHYGAPPTQGQPGIHHSRRGMLLRPDATRWRP